MSVILLIVVLVVLIVAHELGHFVAAKATGMRVDEFGIGYPPRIAAIRRGETEYSLNWLPFGGFVRIFGEDNLTTAHAIDGGRAFSDKNRFYQAVVLVAGVAMNLVLAWVLISASLLAGTARALTAEEIALAPDAAITISTIMPDSPAFEAGLRTGDTVRQLFAPQGEFTGVDAEAFTAFVASTPVGKPVTFLISRDGEPGDLMLSVTPATGVIRDDPERSVIGVGVAVVGTVPMTLLDAPVTGFLYTIELVKQTAVGLAGFFGSIFTLSADISQVAGPVGIAGAVGDAATSGWAPLAILAAVISINLAIINLLPIPALDGGRLLFVLIESIARRRIPSRVAGTANAIGFALLILLMVVVTVNDIGKLVA